MLLRLGLILIAIATAVFAARAAGEQPVVTVNAASYNSLVSPATIAAAFGTGMSSGTAQAATVPLPTQLADVSVSVVDSTNITHLAQLFYVSPGQINFLIPETAAVGVARLLVMNNGEQVAEGDLSIVESSPAIFTVASSGNGLAAALTTYDGQTYDPVVSPDGKAVPIDPGTAWKPKYLSLFGTGLRNSVSLKVKIGAAELTPMYAGPQGTYEGVDQINVELPSNLSGGVVDCMLLARDRISNTAQLLVQGPAAPSQSALTSADVQTLISQAVARAQQIGLRASVAVVDHEGTVLGVFRMTGSPATTRITAFKAADADGLQDADVPAAFAAISKAGTAAFFSTQGNAFTTRTASFIVQEHFPPLIANQPGGPLFGVQFSQLPCSDVKIPNLPLGLAGDSGGVPVYKNGIAAGGIGIEGDGIYSVDINAADDDQSPEEIVAVAGTLGYEAPIAIRGDQILADGIRLPFVNAGQSGSPGPPFGTLPGAVDPMFPIRGAAATRFSPLTLGGVPGRIDNRYYPFKDGALTSGTRLTAANVMQIVTQAAQQAAKTRAAIRRPLGSAAEVNIAVVDTEGNVIGLFSTVDAPIFGFDVAAQKARTAVFFSSATAGAQLRAAESGRFAKFVDAALADGIRLDGSIAFSDRANGFLSRPFFPDGIDGTVNGPFSKPIGVWSPFNTGLQLALVKTALARVLAGQPVNSCTGILSLKNGIQIFAGSVPLYRNGVLAGAIGISGDGIDQDDLVAAAGSAGFEAPEAMRADQFFVRGVRLPFVKFPRHPNL